MPDYVLVEAQSPALLTSAIVAFEDLKCYHLFAKELCKRKSRDAGAYDQDLHVGSHFEGLSCWGSEAERMFARACS